MEEGKPKFENKGLVAVLCVLLVIAVGLGIGIGVVRMNGKAPVQQATQEQNEENNNADDVQVQFLGEEKTEELPGTGYANGDGV